jgi:hypothetical protein
MLCLDGDSSEATVERELARELRPVDNERRELVRARLESKH